MEDVGYAIYAAMYGPESEALIELPVLVSHQDEGWAVTGAAVLRLDSAGRPSLDQPGGGVLAYATGLGGAIGVVAGIWLPSQLLATAAGLVGGFVVGRRMRDGQARALANVLSDFLAPGALAIVAVVDDRLVPVLNRELGLALRRTAVAVAPGPTLELAQALARDHPQISEDLTELADVARARDREPPELG